LFFALTLLSSLFLTQCATVPKKSDALERAQTAYSKAQSNPDVNTYAPVILYEASEALQKAEQAKNAEEMDHFAYIAEMKSRIATLSAESRAAQNERERLSDERNRILMSIRERETEKARSEAELARIEAEKRARESEARALEIQRAKSEAEALARQAEKARKEAEALAQQAEKSRKEAEAKALELEQAKKEAEAKALELEQAKSEAEAALEKKRQLESEIAELKAMKTERGIVLTLGDILFESGKAALMPGAMATIDQLVEFLQKYPNRNIIIEGHTDSVGSENFNLGLSQKRADAVREPLISKGIAAERITTKGYGEQYPVASNATPAGRQQNRRVEIIILDEGVSAEKMLR
jgi:outer membrane protein OmpA-like peptidoglycan-associated protein